MLSCILTNRSRNKKVMMMIDKIGPNAVCPCGSGKKYKKCCKSVSAEHNISSVDFKWIQLRRLENTIIDRHLVPYVNQELPGEMIEFALADFFPEYLPEGLNKEGFFLQLFLPWFFFNWIPSYDVQWPEFNPDETIAQNFANAHKQHLNNREQCFFKAINQSYYSYYNILEVKPGEALVVEDMLLETKHAIKEKKSSYQLRPRDIVLSRLSVLDEQSIFIGMAPIVIPADYHTYASDFKKWLLDSIDHTPLTPQQLRNDFETELFEHFFACVHRIFDHLML